MRRVADVLARELGWDAARLERELEHFAAEASAEGIVAETARAAHADLPVPPAMP